MSSLWANCVNTNNYAKKQDLLLLSEDDDLDCDDLSIELHHAIQNEKKPELKESKSAESLSTDSGSWSYCGSSQCSGTTATTGGCGICMQEPRHEEEPERQQPSQEQLLRRNELQSFRGVGVVGAAAAD